jgi:hypothetical protein
MQDLGRLAYEAYAENRGYRTFNNDDMLDWDHLGVDIQSGWDAAANAVAHAVFDATSEDL